MTLEEGLVALLAAVAAILLFVGLAQALDDRPSASAVRARRRSVARAAKTAGPAAPTRSAVPEAPPRVPYTGPERRHSRRSGSHPRPASVTPPAEAPGRQPDLPLDPEAKPPAPRESPPQDAALDARSEEHTSELQSHHDLVCS